jgi:hypothetical protein
VQLCWPRRAFAGHSLRAGFATESYGQGTPELAIMRHCRWKSASVMRGYVEEGSIWSDNAAIRLGLSRETVRNIDIVRFPTREV